MMDSSTKKASGVFATILIGLIVVSFMFSGAESMKGTPDTIAKVGKHTIDYNDYQAALDRQINFFSMIYNGGKPLSRQQIDQLQLKQQALNQVVSQKIQLILGEKLGVAVGDYQVAQEIMNYEEKDPEGKPIKIFHTNGQFDKIKYKQLLANSSRFTPKKFESLIREQEEMKGISGLLSNVPVSDLYIDELVRFKSEALKVDAIKIEPKKFNQFVKIPDAEVTQYLKEEINAKRVEAIFNEKKTTLDQEEQVKARHILLSNENSGVKKISIEQLVKKVTVKNFSQMAKEYSQEPGAETSGGDLGWFGKGRMVAEFEKVAFNLKPGTISAPVVTKFGTHLIFVEAKKEKKEARFADYQNTIALEQIKIGKSEEASKLAVDVISKLEIALKAKDAAQVKKLVADYNLTMANDSEVSKLERAAGDITFTGAQAKQLFGASEGSVLVFTDSPVETLMVQTKGLTKKNVDRQAEMNLLAKGLSSKFQQDLIKEWQANTKVRIYQEL